MIAVLTYALVAFYLTRLARTLPILRTWTAEGIKPLACNVCMSWWTSLLVALAVVLWEPYGYAHPGEPFLNACIYAFPSAGACLLLLEWVESLEPPIPPRLGE